MASIDMRLKDTVRIVLGGGSGCGKTTWCANWLLSLQECMTHPPQAIFYFYKVWQPLYEKIQRALGEKIQFVQGMPQQDFLESLTEKGRGSDSPYAVCIDDFGADLGPEIVKLFQVLSRHGGIHVVVCLQSFFSRGNKHLRDITLNATHGKMKKRQKGFRD